MILKNLQCHWRCTFVRFFWQQPMAKKKFFWNIFYPFLGPGRPSEHFNGPWARTKNGSKNVDVEPRSGRRFHSKSPGLSLWWPKHSTSYWTPQNQQCQVRFSTWLHYRISHLSHFFLPQSQLCLQYPDQEICRWTWRQCHWIARHLAHQGRWRNHHQIHHTPIRYHAKATISPISMVLYLPMQ